MRFRIPALAAAGLALSLLAGCHQAPAAAEVEAVAMNAAQRGDEQAEHRLRAWAADGVPSAQRELGILYRNRGDMSGVARRLLRQAAQSGDAEAAFQLGDLEQRRGALEEAAQWFRIGAQAGNARAALGLALLLKNGGGVRQDKAEAARWLDLASQRGNAHAMFLLSNALADGDGVPPDPARARSLLERAAGLEYPAAIQQLALVMETGDALTAKDEAEAADLLKEGAEHRRSNARRF